MPLPGKKRYCVFGCSELGAYMHGFPHPERRPELFEKWMSMVGDRLEGLDKLKIYKNRRICAYHFTPDQKVASHRLIYNAVPSVNLNGVFDSPGISVHLEHNYCLATCHPKGSSEQDESTNEDNLTNGIDSNYINGPEDERSEGIFSWQKEEILYPTEDTDVLCPKKGDAVQLQQELEDLSFYKDSLPGTPRDPNPGDDKHAEYQCNVCLKEIIGFRYTCVQCADWDLCGACEARAAHATHYVLRVPGPRPYNEIQTVLAAIRQQLLSENLFLYEQLRKDCVKSEPEDEATGASRDALQPPRAADDRNTDGSEYSPPQRKRRRRRRRASDADNSSDSDTVSDDTYVHSSSDVLLYKPENPFNHGQTDRNTHKENTTKTRSKETLYTQRSIHPILETDTDSLEQPNSKSQKQPRDNVLEIPDTIREVPADEFERLGCIFQVPSDIFEEVTDDSPQVPDNTMVYIEEIPSLDAFSMDPLEEGDGDLLGSDQVMYLQVSPDTNCDALAQALQSQAYVAVQPLTIEELRGAKRRRK